MAYLLGLSSNAWIDLLHELPSKIRVTLETVLAALPLVIVSCIVLQPALSWAAREALDRAGWLFLFLALLVWMASLRFRAWWRKPIPLGETLAFCLVAIIFVLSKKRTAASI